MGMFVKLQKNKRFEIKPRYWNPEEEARQERLKRVRAELGLDEEKGDYVPDVRAGLRQEYEKRRSMRASGRMISSFRMFIILIVLLFVAFYLISYKLEDILNWF